MKYFSLFVIYLICATSNAEVIKCQGSNGSVTYSDVGCGSPGKSINTDFNNLDTSAIRKQAAAASLKESIQQAEQGASAKCKFSSYAIGDAKGKILAQEARDECLRNASAKLQGNPIETSARDAWKEQQASVSQRRQAAATRDAINQQGIQTRAEIENQGSRILKKLDDPVKCTKSMDTISCR
jgi:hypothetical protein